MEILRTSKMPDGTNIQLENWNGEFPTVFPKDALLAAYPVSQTNIWSESLGDTPYPRRGRTFRLAIEFDDAAAADAAMHALETGEAALKDYAQYFRPLPRVSADDLLMCVS